MEKLKILVIAPYEGIIQIIRRFSETCPEYLIDILTELAIQNYSLPSLDEKILEYNSVLAQGEIFKHIQNRNIVPCFEIHITHFDILVASRLSVNYKGKCVFLAAPDIAQKASSLYGLSEFKIEVKNISSDRGIETTITDLIRDGYNLFITDSKTSKICNKYGANTIMLTSSYESVISSLNQAAEYLKHAEKSKLASLVLEEYIVHTGRSYLIFDDGENLIQASNIDNIQKLISTARQLIPAVKKEREIHRINIINAQPFLIKGSLIRCADKKYIIFEAKKSLMNSKTNIPGIVLKNVESISKDFYNIFYDDLRNPEFYNKVRSYSASGSPVVIIGESGTGKSRLADFIYDNCTYRNNLFYIVDCKQLDKRGLNYMFSSISSPLYENGITLYFKEINLIKRKYVDELVEFLKQSPFIENNKLIFSVTCSLNESYNNRLCELLTSKLGSFPLFLTPLRDRAISLPSLSVLYINKLNEEFNKHIVGFEPEAMNYLQGFSWNDNIKQFKRVLKELFTITNANYISKQDVISILREESREDHEPVAMKRTPDMTLKQITLDAVRDALISNNMNQTKAAKQLGISRTSLWRFLNKHIDT